MYVDAARLDAIGVDAKQVDAIQVDCGREDIRQINLGCKCGRMDSTQILKWALVGQ